jgi:hypothetical protein
LAVLWYQHQLKLVAQQPKKASEEPGRQLQGLGNGDQTLEILLQPLVEGDDSCYGGGTLGEEDSSSGAQPQPSLKDGADVLRNVQLMIKSNILKWFLCEIYFEFMD